MNLVKNLKKSYESNALGADLKDLKSQRYRGHRLRRSGALREMMQETHLRPEHLVYPIFVEENVEGRTPLTTMPGVFRESEKTLEARVKEVAASGVKSIILFGVSHNKDHTGSDSLYEGGLLARMIRIAKQAAPDLVVIGDLCFCEYTDHGHCGPMSECGGFVDNDRTIANIAKQALIVAEAGADMVAPSGMMDGQVGVIRAALDQNGFAHLPIMAYASKFASGFYGPFREAAGTALGKGDRKTYQMNPANGREAIREALQDEAEGADILMVKPGLAYLDILADLRRETTLPLAAYQVSGEYAMIKFAAAAGAIDEQTAMMESLLSFRRAGAQLILSYFTMDAVALLKYQY